MTLTNIDINPHWRYFVSLKLDKKILCETLEKAESSNDDVNSNERESNYEAFSATEIEETLDFKKRDVVRLP